MLGLRETLIQRIERQEKDLKWTKLSLIGAAVLVVLYLPLVAHNLLGGWRPSGYFHVFVVVIWAGFFVVQYKIWQKKKEVFVRLANELRELGGEQGGNKKPR